MSWASAKSMESGKNVKTRWRENQCLGLEGQDAQHHTRLLSVDASFPLRGFSTPANSGIQRYIRCMTLGLVKSRAKQHQLKKSDTELHIMWPAYNYTPTCTHTHTQHTVLCVTCSLWNTRLWLVYRGKMIYAHFRIAVRDLSSVTKENVVLWSAEVPSGCPGSVNSDLNLI